jgi:hypothetical protein
VTWDQGTAFYRQLAGDNVQVGSANSAGSDAQEHLPRPDLRFGNVSDNQGAFFDRLRHLKNGGLHGLIFSPQNPANDISFEACPTKAPTEEQAPLGSGDRSHDVLGAIAVRETAYSSENLRCAWSCLPSAESAGLIIAATRNGMSPTWNIFDVVNQPWRTLTMKLSSFVSLMEIRFLNNVIARPGVVSRL